MHAYILKAQERERGKSGHYPQLPVMQMFACLFKEIYVSILMDEKPSGLVVSYETNILNPCFQITLKTTSAIRHMKQILETSIKITQAKK